MLATPPDPGSDDRTPAVRGIFTMSLPPLSPWSVQLASLFCLLLVPVCCCADEGMWLFNDLPKEQLRVRCQFTPSEAWADHVRLSSVRFNSGGSASFVSSNGLVITNHHVASDTLYKISDEKHNYLDDGFRARTLADEVKAPDLELNQLVSLEDVTDCVNAAVT
jgi:S1-C subfamily serine protease